MHMGAFPVGECHRVTQQQRFTLLPYFFIVFTLYSLFLFHPKASASDFGVTGLVSMPSARVMPDGFLAATFARNEVADIYNLSFQLTPWIETAFRYSIFNPRKKQVPDSILENRREAVFLRDRSYEIKFLLQKESAFKPSIALGLRDILGTGVWGGEYLVASKKAGSFDLSLGLGWGRFAGRPSFSNPLSWISDAFKQRPLSLYEGLNVGEVRSKSFFRGDVGIFGGLKYRFSTLPVSLVAEYASNDYGREFDLGLIGDTNPLSLSLEWHISPLITLSFSSQQGAFYGLSLRSVLDVKKTPKKKYPEFYSSLDPEGKAVAPDFLDLSSWYDRLLFDAERSGLRIYQVETTPGSDTANFLLANDEFSLWADAIAQFFKISSLHLPVEIEKIQVQTLEENLLGPSIIYFRKPTFPYSLIGHGAVKDSASGVAVMPGSTPLRPSYKTSFLYPRLAIGADLAVRVQVMDPDEPVKRQVYLKGTARLAVSDSLNLWSVYSLNINSDFNTKRPSDSVLPRVRSDINQYLTQGENGIDSLFIEMNKSLNPDFHMRFIGGYLEEMFGGVGVEFLWSPLFSRVALGGNFNYVKQRSFEKTFKFRDYEASTGHLSLFYSSPWYDTDFALHAGRYLAGDSGYTIEARRTFDNGFEIGAFFSRTNVSAESFGEGSFDKGFFLKVPFNLFTNKNTRGSYSTIVRPVERDGGRRLEGNVGGLWWHRRALRYDALQRNINRMKP
jgi:hypothetical protein